MADESVVTENMEELKEAFSLFDKNNDGLISLSEMSSMMERLSAKMTEGEVKAVMSLADRDNNGNIDFEEFHHLWALVMGNSEEENDIKKEFLRFDLDRDGFITKDEMLKVIENEASFVHNKLEEARKCIEEMDVNDDGQVSYPEFLLIWRFKD